MTDPRRDTSLVSAVMGKVRSVNTASALTLRRELHRRGLRNRIHDARLPGKPDLVFASARIVEFVTVTSGMIVSGDSEAYRTSPFSFTVIDCLGFRRFHGIWNKISESGTS